MLFYNFFLSARSFAIIYSYIHLNIKKHFQYTFQYLLFHASSFYKIVFQQSVPNTINILTQYTIFSIHSITISRFRRVLTSFVPPIHIQCLPMDVFPVYFSFASSPIIVYDCLSCPSLDRKRSIFQR